MDQQQQNREMQRDRRHNHLTQAPLPSRAPSGRADRRAQNRKAR